MHLAAEQHPESSIKALTGWDAASSIMLLSVAADMNDGEEKKAVLNDYEMLLERSKALHLHKGCQLVHMALSDGNTGHGTYEPNALVPAVMVLLQLLVGSLHDSTCTVGSDWCSERCCGVLPFQLLTCTFVTRS